MPTIREVVTKFSLEVDEAQAKNVDARVEGLKQNFGGLGKFVKASIGVAGAKSFFSLGQTATRAEWNLRRLSGVQFDSLREQFLKVRKEIDSINAGAGKIITKRQFDIAAAGFLKVFGRGKDQVDAFGKIFQFAAKQAIITGEEVSTIVDQIQSGIQGGGFDALLELPGFDVFRKKLLEFQQQAIDPGEPGGRIALQNRLKAIMGIITTETQDQNEALRQVPKILLETDKLAKDSKNSFEQLAQSVNKFLIPVFKNLNLVMDKTSKILDRFTKAKTFGDAVKQSLEIAGAGYDPERKGYNPITELLNFFTPNKQSGSGGKTEMNIQNTFQIKSTDPKEAAQEVAKTFQDEYKRARQELQPVED